MKRQAKDWEKIFVDHISDKGLISKIYEELLKLTMKEPNPIRKWVKYLNRHFTEKDKLTEVSTW